MSRLSRNAISRQAEIKAVKEFQVRKWGTSALTASRVSILSSEL